MLDDDAVSCRFRTQPSRLERLKHSCLLLRLMMRTKRLKLLNWQIDIIQT